MILFDIVSSRLSQTLPLSVVVMLLVWKTCANLTCSCSSHSAVNLK